MTESRQLPKIALGLAGLAVVLAGIATIVVVTRNGEDRSVARGATGANVDNPAGTAQATSVRVPAPDVVRLKRDGEVVTEHGATGLRVADDQLRQALGLERGDLITAISGRAIAKSFDVYDILLGTSMMNATSLYAEVRRGGATSIVRWQLDGDLRAARYADNAAAASGLTAGAGGGAGIAGTPPAAPAADPFAGTVIKLDDVTYQIPRTTIDAVMRNPMPVASGARVVPSIKDGKPHGFKLYAIRAGSLFAALGLQNGDTLVAINQRALTTPDSALEAYVRIKDADQLVIELERRGAPVVLTITITK